MKSMELFVQELFHRHGFMLDGKPFFRISHSQGDYVAWEGLGDDAVLVDQLMTGQDKAALTRIRTKGCLDVDVRTRSHGPSVPSIEVTVETDLDEEADLTDRERDALQAFEAAVTERVEWLLRQAHRVLHEYALVLHMPPEEAVLRTYRTRRFTVEVRLVEGADHGLDDPLADMDPRDVHDVVQDLADDPLRYFAGDLTVTVYGADGVGLGWAPIGGVVTEHRTPLHRNPHAMELARDRAREAIKAARDWMGRMCA